MRAPARDPLVLIATSALDPPPDVGAAPIDAYFTKPLDMAALIAMLESRLAAWDHGPAISA